MSHALNSDIKNFFSFFSQKYFFILYYEESFVDFLNTLNIYLTYFLQNKKVSCSIFI